MPIHVRTEYHSTWSWLECLFAELMMVCSHVYVHSEIHLSRTGICSNRQLLNSLLRRRLSGQWPVRLSVDRGCIYVAEWICVWICWYVCMCRNVGIGMCVCVIYVCVGMCVLAGVLMCSNVSVCVSLCRMYVCRYVCVCIVIIYDYNNVSVLMPIFYSHAHCLTTTSTLRCPFDYKFATLIAT